MVINSPRSTSSQHQGDTISCQDSGQPREIAVSVCCFLKHLLVDISLRNHTIKEIRVQFLFQVPLIRKSVWFVPVCLDYVWRKLFEDTWGEDVPSTSFSCWATQQSSRDQVRPLYVEGSAASEHELLYSPASAPTGAENRRQIRDKVIELLYKW